MVLKVFFENVIWDAVHYMEHSKCKTLTSVDLVCAKMLR